jgi:hypothetical protein
LGSALTNDIGISSLTNKCGPSERLRATTGNGEGKWRSLKPGDVVFLIRKRKYLCGYAVVEGTFNNYENGLEDFPLGIRFKEVDSVPEFDASIEIAELLGMHSNPLGIVEVNLAFASYALRKIRSMRGGDKMWVTPNPFLIAETDIEQTESEIFVVMPWEFRHTVYKSIRDICEKHNYTATYAAETGGQVVLEDIWRLINRARAVIIDFSKSRPNVYLEFGMAIVLGKPIIAITQSGEECPSDVRNIKYILYNLDHADHILEKELPKALRDTIQQVEQMAAKRNANP